MKEAEPTTPTKVSKPFVNILAILSILGFTSIISYTLLDVNITAYIESLWLIILGLGFTIEAHPIQLFKRIKNQLKERNFTALTTLTVGVLAITAGILSLPQINIQNPGFLAVKGIMSIIAIIFIVVQTWIINKNSY
ncbi:hypothetical protein HNV12_00940 [Methanococcoides sp. SA1]|nr:hypothetical protein [Methanococcoides sp. SA1]